MNSSLFFHSLCIIQSDVINCQHVLTSFAVFQSFTDLFRELNDGEIENHYKTNCENVETWHGIIISPTWHVKNTREGYSKNWTHFVYKMDNLFRSMRVSDEKSSVTKAFHFLNNLSITKLNIMIKHTNIKHKKKESLKNLFSKLCYSQTSGSHKFQIIQNLNYSNL